jgi:RNA polymerase sigma factor (sigma-70 family)
VAILQEQPTDDFLRQLRLSEPQEAWAKFLDTFSPLILQVVRLFEREDDAVADCFLFVCEQLSRNRFRRLQRFRTNGPARFSTWLCAVVRNLCMDWHRREFGRQRPFESIARLPAFDQELYRCLNEQNLPLEEAYLRLRPRFPEVTLEQVNESAARIQRALTPRQRWLLSVRHARVEQTQTGGSTEDVAAFEIADLAADPESLANLAERRAALHRALAQLSKSDRLLIRLRFEREMTLEQVAHVLHLNDAYCADRRIKEALEKLRREMA